MSAKRVLAGGLATVAAAVGALASAPAALATNGSSTNATWAGKMPVASPNDPGYLWSDGGLNGLNWSGAAVPGATLNVLSFPDLPTCDGPTAPADACYTGYDDLGAIDVNKLSFGGSKSASQSYNLYEQSGSNSTITVEGDGTANNVGLTGTPPAGSTNLNLGTFGIPIIINSPQQWNISGAGAQYGGGILYLDSIGSTANQALTLNLTQEATLEPVDVTTGPITVDGNGTLQLDYLSGSPERLPAVTLSDSDSALVIAAHGATSGNINMSGSSGNQFYILTNGIGGAGQDSAEATLAVNGNVATDGTTTMEFDIDGNNTAAGTDSSELTDSAGTVSLGGAAISLWQAQVAGKCVALTPGNTYTLVSAHALSGQISVGGQAVSQGGSGTETLQSNTNACSTGSSSTQTNTSATVNYNANSITATIDGVQAGTQAPAISGTAKVGDRLTVTSNGGWNASPAPAYTYQWYSCKGSNCSAIGSATGSSYTLTSAEAGKSVKVKVTATNSYGSATAFSNTRGPVNGGIKPALTARIRADLQRLAHPAGRRAVEALLRHGTWRASFSAPTTGTLSVTWTAAVTLGHGRHAKHRTYVIARGQAHGSGGHAIALTMRLTAEGKRLLREHLLNLRVTASERFLAAGSGWTTMTKRFTL